MAAEARGKLILDTFYNDSGLNAAAQGIKSIESELSGLGGKLSVVTLGLSGMVTSKVLGAIGDAVGEFNKLSKAGAIFTGNLDELREATKGTVGNLELMTSHNRLMLEGIKLSSAETKQLYGDIKRVSSAMGVEFSDAMSAVERGLMGMSRGMKAQLGIVVDLKDAQKDLAEKLHTKVEWLTEDEKRTANLNATMDALHGRSGKVTASVSTMGDEWKKLSNQIKEATQSLILWIAAQARSFVSPGHGLEDLEKSDVEAKKRAEEEWAASGLVGSTGVAGEGSVSQVGGGRGSGSAFGAMAAADAAARGKRFDLAAVIRDAQRSFKEAKGSDALLAADAYRSGRITLAQFIAVVGDGTEKAKAKKKEVETGWYMPAARSENEGKFGLAGFETSPVKGGLPWAGVSEEGLKTKGEAAMEGAFPVGGMGEAAQKIFEHNIQQAIQYRDTWNDVSKGVKEAMSSMKEQGIDTFGALGGGFMGAALAALDGSKSFGQAMGEMTKSVLTSVAIQAAAQAALAWGRYIFSWGTDVAALGAATTWTTAAAVYGAMAGIAVALVGGSSGSGGSSGGAGHSESSADRYTPSFGTRESQKERTPIIIHVQFDRSDPAAELYARRKVKASVTNG